ncbi:MAG: hypothetical protein ACPLKQ_05000 [Candidatus Bathyarchaeales archaeon]
MIKQKSSTLGVYVRFIITLIGLIWLILGIFVATSPKIVPKILQWNYILAWILLFGFPCILLIGLGLHGHYQKLKAAGAEKKQNSQNILMRGWPFRKNEKNAIGVGEGKTKDKKKFADMVYVENVYLISTEHSRNNAEQARILTHTAKSPEQLWSEEFSETKFCHYCRAIISEDEYERYGGLCHGCYIDFKRELRRSGLFGADRASTW